MIYVIPGILGFMACCLFDINKIRWNIRFLNLFFVIGSVLLIGSSILCILQADFSSIFSNFGFYHCGIGIIIWCLCNGYSSYMQSLFK